MSAYKAQGNGHELFFKIGMNIAWNGQSTMDRLIKANRSKDRDAKAPA